MIKDSLLITNPKLNSFFKNNLDIKIVHKLLKLYQFPSEIPKITLTKLSNLLIKSSHGKYNKQKAVELKDWPLIMVISTIMLYVLKVRILKNKLKISLKNDNVVRYFIYNCWHYCF